jgi:hypothetical protein
MLITSRLDQDVQHDAVLVDGSPQPRPMTTDADRYFVEDASMSVNRCGYWIGMITGRGVPNEIQASRGASGISR